MATGMKMPASLTSCLLLFFPILVTASVLTPPTFNLAQRRKITATATCGVGVASPELFCRLTPTSNIQDQTLIQGQLCDYCIPNDPFKSHKPEFAIDGTERWWQSPPLSRVGPELNEVNLTLSLGQEFHVAYVFIKMANSPRPGVWVLERSVDFGQTWIPWQYFADTPNACLSYFNTTADLPLVADDQVLCTTKFSKVVPVSDGEIVVSIVEDRPNAHNFSYATVLHEWTKATDIQLRLLRTRTLKADLMDVARQDPTTFRRYFYSIKDISIGGRCVCNGHAQTCEAYTDRPTNKLVCKCVANTCGDKCEYCCPGFVQKRWRRALIDRPYECEPCNCHGHSGECVFDEDVERDRLSLDIFGQYEGGGVCQNCRDNTKGINCEQCVSGFYRPYGVPRNATDACRPCMCDLRVSTGECEEGSGRCLCRKEYTGTLCDSCNDGYYGYPTCIPCDCDVNGTEGSVCTVGTGACPCKSNFAGQRCNQCAPGFYNFPDCIPCECNDEGSEGTVCDLETGQCRCNLNYGSRDCGECADGFFNFPGCRTCTCDSRGCEDEICDKVDGSCLCKLNYTGDSCDQCVAGFFNFPYCEECLCEIIGSESEVCSQRGQCSCRENYAGRACDRCAAGYFKYPDCVACDCNYYGSLTESCSQDLGQCTCRDNFVGQQCGECAANLYNYPNCEVCNCNPDGAKEVPGYPLGGCGIVTSGRLCECKERVLGRICDRCQPGYWNLNRNNPQGCQECGCNMAGTLSNVKRCNMETGQCECKPYATGQNCDRCRSGFFDLQEANPFGCRGCKCNPGGSRHSSCDMVTGQCSCKEKVGGLKCDQPLEGYFVPDLHQYKFELENGKTPENVRVRYGYNETIFPKFSWRGYAILTEYQPEVILDVDIRLPSLYQIIFRFVNQEGNPVKGTVVLTPDSETENTQEGEVNFLPLKKPSFASVTSGGIQAYVLNPGRWTISTKVPKNVFLDYFVLIPQSFYEGSQLQDKITDPCVAAGDPGPCVAITYPDLDGFPSAKGKDGYHKINGQHQEIDIETNRDLVKELGSTGLALLTKLQDHFLVDLIVPVPDDYILIVNYHNPLEISQDLDVKVNTGFEITEGSASLPVCRYSSLCRQVIRGSNGLEAVFNISSGYAALTFTASKDAEEIHMAIDSVYAIPRSRWGSIYALPRIICIKVNGVCVSGSYDIPVGTVLIEFESFPNQGFLSIILPNYITDPTIRLVNLNDSKEIVNETVCEERVCTEETVVRAVPLELLAKITKPGDYILVVQYYMSTESRLDIPVTLYDDGQQKAGMFQPGFCPSKYGCRVALVFDQPEGRNIMLRGPQIKILFNGTLGRDIWLDYLLVIPASQFSPEYLDFKPVDKAQNFMEKCVDEGFQLNMTDPYCRAMAFTLTTNFNNGALDCDCNADGSESFTCTSDGGNCVCKENVIGRKCSACVQGFFGFPNCRRCDCPYGICHEVTGKCICPPNVEGEKCDRCKPGAYGYDPIIGCQQCNCDLDGTVDRNTSCHQSTGKCDCKPTVGGRRCETCLAGYHSFPECLDCGCDSRGTHEEICDQRSARCLCKDNVQGQYCDQCADGMYSLTAENPKGCIKCFCFGHTTRCDSSGLSWDMVSDMTNWTLAHLLVDNITTSLEDMETTFVSRSEDGTLDDPDLFWFAPYSYLGKKLNAYGGKLKYTVLVSLRDGEETSPIIKENILMTGSNMSIVYFHNTHPAANVPFLFEVELREYNFNHQGTNAPVSREQFMMVLLDLSSIVIRGSYFDKMEAISLKDVTLEVATVDGQGQLAESVEMCQCPSNFEGDSCEVCAPGSYRPATSTSLDICIRCNCNGHSTDCDIHTGECNNCRDNTTGSNCEQCLPGYYGDPRTGGCSICSCPLPNPANNFATTCRADEQGYMQYCQCQPGYTGRQCESCAPGYYGNPLERGDYCKRCDCSGNINTNIRNSCDNIGGACLICENDSAGAKCQRCRDWFYGDAVVRKDCQPCSCDLCGSNSCDYENGTCECKHNVEGAACDRCAPNTWGFNLCNGCQDCECGVGSLTGQCDLQLGFCTCQPGVEGEKCDRCQPNHWNIGPSGCQACDCFGEGAVGCDPETGRCQCLPGVTGEQCDRCLPRWVLVPNRGCQECDYCVHLLIDDLDSLARDVTQVSRALADVSVGVGAFNKLAYYNETVEILRPAVEALQMMDTNELKNSSAMLGEKVNNISQETREVFDKSVQLEYEAQLLPENVDTLIQNVSDLYTETEQVVTFSNGVVSFTQEVNRDLRESRSALNLERFISDSEDIVQVMESRNFSSQSDLCNEELKAAEEVKENVEGLKMNATTNYNRTEDIDRDISDVTSRLHDVVNSSRISQANADTAMRIIQRLGAVQMVHLTNSLDNIEAIKTEREEMLENATMLLKEAEEFLEAAESNITDIESQSSRLDSALPSLQAYTDQVSSEMDGLYDMTNQSQVHAQKLAAFAAELEQLYESTRNRSQDPVDAGQAYRTIENAIAEAKASADKAVMDADEAKDESENIHNNVTDALAESEALLEEAKQLNNQTQNRLQDALDQDRNAFMEAKKEHDGVENLLSTLTEGMAKLNGSSTAPISTAIMDKNNDTMAIHEKVKQLSQSVIDKTNDMNEKNDYIVFNAPKAADDLRLAKESVDSAEKSQPEIENMVNRLSDVADRVSQKSQTLGINVDALKEKIAQARDAANRIKVGLRFLGNTSITLRNPPTLKDTGSYSTVSMFVKTTQSDALLMYMGNNQNVAESSRKKRSITFVNDVVEQILDDDEDEDCPMCIAPLMRQKRQVPDFQSDYLGLELQDGNVVFTVNLGSGAGSVVSTRKVNDGKWHQIKAERIGKTATLTVRSESQEDDVNEGTTQGAYAVLELNPINTNIVVGALPDAFTLPQGMSTTSFEGAIEEVEFDGEPLGLWNFVEGENNMAGESERDFGQTQHIKGDRFNGYGYAVLSKKLFRLQPSSTRVELSFKTYSEDGLMFYIGKDDYFALEIKGGHVYFRFDLGGGPSTAQSSAKYNDGEWHKVFVDRNKRSATILIDDKTEEIQLQAAGNLNNLETTDDIYIGGVDNVLHLHRSVMPTGFDGCMQDVRIARETVNLFENKRAKGLTKGCFPKITHIMSFPGYKDGYVGIPSVSIGGMFDLTFKMKTKKETALLMLAANSDQSNMFAVFISEGKIVVVEKLNLESKELSSKINTYSDAEWHHISIMKMQGRITMSIDDTEMVEDKSVSADLTTDSALYFGGLPLDYEVTSDAVLTTEGLAGCMGDITINKKFKNLAHVQERHGITLAECTMEKEAAVVKPTIPPDLPSDQCALPLVASGTEEESAKVTGNRFGSTLHSRYEYRSLPARIIVQPVYISIHFKTTGQNGVIFYTAGENHLDFLGLYMDEGHLVFGFNCGTGAAIMKSPQTYNDGKWHKVIFSRISQSGELTVDGEGVAKGRSQGLTKSLNTAPPYFLGGISEEATKIAHKNLKHVVGSFHGCITNVTVNMKNLENPSFGEDVLPCSDDLESGSFIGSGGGYIQMIDTFNVGKKLEITLQVRPRSQEGVLVAVHGSGNDFLVLQMSEGSLILSVDNGGGIITLTFELATKNTLCDGNWHDIKAIKTNSELDLIVDGASLKDTVSEKSSQTSADTNGPLYIGGVPDKTAKGIITTGDFVGCIRHVHLDMKAQNIAAGTPTGDVHLGSCPVR